MPLNPFSKKENKTRHPTKSSSSYCSSSSSDKRKELCCKKKFAKIANGILSTGLVASQCEINRINNNVLIVEPKFEAVLTTVMQSMNAILGESGCSGPGNIESVAYDVMVNSVWSDITTWEKVDPCLTNYLWVYEFTYNDYLNHRWGNFNVLNNDIFEIKYDVTDVNQGMSEITLGELANYESADSPLYYKQIVDEALNVQKMLAQIFPQISVPLNNSSANFKPIISNATYRDVLHCNKLKNARVAVWREQCNPALDDPPCVSCDNGKFYIAGFSSNACRKPCSPCK